MNRRSFFQSIAKAAAIVALAPQLAFRVKPIEVKAVEVQAYWLQETRYSSCFNEEYEKFMRGFLKENLWK